MLLEMFGHHLQTAYGGNEALELADRFRPHAILLDISLPGLDGYQLARTIRSLSWGASTLLIALTGWGQEEDRRQAYEAGFDHHLTKPVSGDVIESLLRSAPRLCSR